MMKKNKEDFWFIFGITLFIIMFVFIITKFGKYYYGSVIDWNCQHYMIPDYFRKLFYKTKDIFPDFAMNLGSGQNIYYLSYYGLLSPIILFSYLLPFISMKTYIQISSIFLVWLSVLLMYRWMKTKVSTKLAMILSVIFMLSTPILYHSHRHIMFINYMPFLIMALIGVDKYFRENKKSLLIISIYLITSSSYFFSIGAIICVILYGIYVYIKNNIEINFKNFIKDGIKFLLPIITGIMISSILLIPTFLTLLSGRSSSTSSVNLLSLFIPNTNVNSFLYGAYSMGLTSIIFLSIIYGIIYLKREKKYICISMMMLFLFPIFTYILNGTLYVNSKVLIPFIPICILIISNFINSISKKDNLKLLIIIFIAISIMLILFNKNNILFIIDSLLLVLSLLIFYRFNKKSIIIMSAFLIGLTNFISANYSEKYVNKNDIKVTNDLVQLYKDAYKADKSFYRISDKDNGLYTANNIIDVNTYQTTIYSSLSNQNYVDFYYNQLGNDILNRSTGQLSNPKNLLFNIYFGNKYIIGNKTDNIGYTYLKNINAEYLYLNKNALPIGYSNNRLMSLKEYNKLKYPYNVEAMLNYTIIDKDIKTNYITNIEKKDIDYTYTFNNLTIDSENDYIKISAKDNATMKFSISDDLSKKILFIKFDMLESNSCSIGDSYIKINDITNKLTCKGWKYYNKNNTFEYTLSNTDLKVLNVSLAKGIYKIKNIEFYTIDYEKLVDGYSDNDEFIIDRNSTYGDIINGVITTTKEGYFNLSIPFDNNFIIYVDGKKIDYEKVDTSFIGFKLKKGFHKIKIEYVAPMKNISKNISIVGILILISTIYIETGFKRKKTKKHI